MMLRLSKYCLALVSYVALMHGYFLLYVFRSLLRNL
jgi:hypothetical protein